MRRPEPLRVFTLLIASFILLILPGCDSDEAEETANSSKPPGAANDELGMLRVKIADLQKHSNSTTTYEGNLFSGQAVELAEDGTRIHEQHYFEGLLHGPVRSFYSDGSSYSDVMYEKGVLNGLSIEWDQDGNMTQIIYKDGVEVARMDPEKKEATE